MFTREVSSPQTTSFANCSFPNFSLPGNGGGDVHSDRVVGNIAKGTAAETGKKQVEKLKQFRKEKMRWKEFVMRING